MLKRGLKLYLKVIRVLDVKCTIYTNYHPHTHKDKTQPTNQRRVQDFLNQEQIPFFWRAETRPKSARFISVQSKKNCPWEGEGLEYLIIDKEILVLASAPYASNESFLHPGQKNNISNFIRGIFPLRPTAPHASATNQLTHSRMKSIKHHKVRMK